jgi:hypothetical protein
MAVVLNIDFASTLYALLPIAAPVPREALDGVPISVTLIVRAVFPVVGVPPVLIVPPVPETHPKEPLVVLPAKG